MSSPDLIDSRFDSLVRELRLGRPLAHPELRERVRATASSEPRSRVSWLPKIPARRAVLILTPALVAAGLGLAVVRGLVDSSPNRSPQRELVDSSPNRSPQRDSPRALSSPRGASTSGQLQLGHLQAFAPSARRLEQYDATLRVRVRNLGDLAAASQTAIRTTRRLGGYVVSADLNSPTVKRGEAKLAVRVPIGRVQDAIASFAGLGEPVSQHIRLLDLQQTVDAQTRSIRSLRREIARLQDELAKPQTAAAAARLKRALGDDQVALDGLAGARQTTLERGRFARLDLTLTTRATAVTFHHGDRLDRTLGKAGSVLLRELELLVYGFVGAGPLVLLAAVAIAIRRTRTRRANERLLESA